MGAVGVEESWEYRSDVIAYDTMLVSQHTVCVWETRRYGEGGREQGLTHTEIHHHYLSRFYRR